MKQESNMKCRRVRPILIWPLFICAFFCQSVAHAQKSAQDSPMAHLEASSLVLPRPLSDQILVPLSEDNTRPEDPEMLDVHVVFLPSNTRVLRRDIRAIKYAPDKRSLLIELSPLV